MKTNQGASTKGPLRGRYLVRNFIVNATLRCIDFMLDIFTRKQTDARIVAPQAILFSNIGHLGDVIIATSVLPAVKKAFPDAKIGFLVGSWSAHLVNTHPMVDRVHIVDNWKLNRSNIYFLSKVFHYFKTRSCALRQMRHERYAVAIDLYYFFPNSIILLWQSRIPIRIGYISAGFGPLLTHAIKWRDQKDHVLEYHQDLLRLLPITEDALDLMRPKISRSTAISLKALLADISTPDFNYIIVHIGTGAPFREWPADFWRTLVSRLSTAHVRMFFTGAGATEFAKIESIINGIDGCVSICNKLSWYDFVEVIAGAKAVVGVESMAGHLAAAVDTPFVVIKTGVTSNMWRPFGSAGTVLSHPVACAPCYLKKGCKSMDCVRQVSVDAVYNEIVKFLPPIK